MNDLQSGQGVPTQPVVPKRLRVAVLNRVFTPTGGGAERYSIAMVEQLAQRHDIHVFAQKINHQWPGVIYHVLPSFLERPRWINQLWFALTSWWATRQGFDLVHSHENTWHGQVQTIHVVPIKFGLFAGRSSSAKVLRWLKIVTSPRLLVYLWLESMRYRRKPGRVLVPTSSALQRVMVQTHPSTRTMLQTVSPGVVSVPGAALAAQQLKARGALGLPEGPKCILFVANDFRKKGLNCLLQAVAQLPQTDSEVFLAVVGNLQHASGFAAQIESLGLKQRVYFLGVMTDVSQAYQAATCLAHPTLEDTFGMVVLEAMSHGLPVIVSAEAFCGISGLLTQDVNALILQNPRDVKALSGHLHSLLSDDGLRSRLGSAASSFAEGHLWSEIAIKQELIYLQTHLAMESATG